MNFYDFLLCTDDVPKKGRAHFCIEHILPWCGEYEMPVLYCTCVSCMKLPDKWRCQDIIPCGRRKLDIYLPDLSEFYDLAKDPKSINIRLRVVHTLEFPATEKYLS